MVKLQLLYNRIPSSHLQKMDDVAEICITIAIFYVCVIPGGIRMKKQRALHVKAAQTLITLIFSTSYNNIA